jgi:MFS transporter, ACS family, D-galactonate transporter
MSKPTSPTTLSELGQPSSRTQARFFVLGLLAVGTMINYLDRAVLSIAAPSLSKELVLDPAVMGIVFSAFSWTYAAAQIPGGVLLDRLAPNWSTSSRLSSGRSARFCSVSPWDCIHCSRFGWV